MTLDMAVRATRPADQVPRTANQRLLGIPGVKPLPPPDQWPNYFRVLAKKLSIRLLASAVASGR
jgi:hypothetical protein